MRLNRRIGALGVQQRSVTRNDVNHLLEQVSWWDTHLFIAELVAHYNDLPVAGTPRWCALDGSDPWKLIALAIDGVHHVLRKETAQQARAEVSRDVCSSADWPQQRRSVAA